MLCYLTVCNRKFLFFSSLLISVHALLFSWKGFLENWFKREYWFKRRFQTCQKKYQSCFDSFIFEQPYRQSQIIISPIFKYKYVFIRIYFIMNKIIIGSFLALILFSLYLIASNSTKPGETSRRVIATSKVSGPSPVNIDLDSSFNNFKNFSTLTYNRLHCELYEEKGWSWIIQRDMCMLWANSIHKSMMHRHQSSYWHWSRRSTRWRLRRVSSKVTFALFRLKTLETLSDQHWYQQAG